MKDLAMQTETANACAANLTTVDIAQLARSGAFPRFALNIRGTALAPRINDGEMVIVDIHVLPIPGDAIVIEVGGKLTAMLVNADGDAYDLRGGHYDRDEYTIIGVIVEGGED
jgi:phage repressor protein C with HTH and peptisase S24 domain